MRPTPAQITELEAKGCEPLEVPELGDFVAYLRPFSPAEFREFINTATRPGADGENARVGAMYRATVFPSRAELGKAYAVFPGLRAKIVDAIERWSGKFQETWIPLDASTDPDLLDELKIPLEDAATLRASYPYPGQLWICHVPDLDIVLVVVRPNATVYARLRERIQLEGQFFDACVDAAVDCVVWPAPELFAATQRECPALAPLVLADKLLELARGEQGAAKKGFMPKGRRSAT